MMWDLRQDREGGGPPPPIVTASSHHSHHGPPSPIMPMPSPQDFTQPPELMQRPPSATPYGSVPFPTSPSYAGYPGSATGQYMPTPATPTGAPVGYSRSRSNSYNPGVGISGGAYPPRERHTSHSSNYDNGAYPDYERGRHDSYRRSRHNSYNGGQGDGRPRSRSRHHSQSHSHGRTRSRANSYNNLSSGQPLVSPGMTSYPSAPVPAVYNASVPSSSSHHSHSHPNHPIPHARSYSGDAPYTSGGVYGDAWDMRTLASQLGPPTATSATGMAVRSPVGWDRDADVPGVGVQYHSARDVGDDGWRAEERDRGVLIKHSRHQHTSSHHHQPHHTSVGSGGGHHHGQSYGGDGRYGDGRYASGGSGEGKHVAYGDRSGQHPDFCYSKCSGRKKALCIGINYNGSRNELKGCVNDAKSVYHFLVNYHHYKPGDIVFLSDEARDPRSQPTRKNMINAMRWLVQGAKKHDALFFHYSGHGAQTKDKDGDEVDGYDEVIFPVDFKQAGIITDDELHDVMVSNLQPGVRLTAVFDSCHSGSVLDLPFLYHSDGRLRHSDVTARFRKLKATPADVITWSGCKDSETSADTYQGGLAVGAMSYAFIKILKANQNISYEHLLQGLREILKSKYKQKPQLSSSHRIDTHLKFVM